MVNLLFLGFAICYTDNINIFFAMIFALGELEIAALIGLRNLVCCRAYLRCPLGMCIYVNSEKRRKYLPDIRRKAIVASIRGA